jgi:dTDP-4-amino-4,6-dideoxygalactose transaminase
LEIGRGGAILTDNKGAYDWFKKASYDGRDLNIHPWQDQKEFQVGYHYMMRPEECIIGLNKLNIQDINNKPYIYPDISNINIS